MNIKRKHVIVVASVPLVVLWVLFSPDPLRQLLLTGVRSLTFTAIWDVWKGSKVEWKGVGLEIPRGKYWWGHTTSGQVSLNPRNNLESGLLTLREAEAGKDYFSIAKARCQYRTCEPIPDESLSVLKSVPFIAVQVLQNDGSKLRYATLMDKERKFLIETVSTPTTFSADITTALAIWEQLHRSELLSDREPK